MNQLNKDINELKQYFAKETPVITPTKPLDQEVNEEMDNPQYNQQKLDAKFLVKCFKYLKKLGNSEMMAQDAVGGILKHLYSLRANSFGPQCVHKAPCQSFTPH